jgi:hypothetical protein
MGKPLSKAPEGGLFDILRGQEGVAKSELEQGSETEVWVCLTVRPEAFPTGLPMSVMKIHAQR